MKNRNAFTLIEILVVVCVITILIGLTASATFSARRKASVSAATTEVEQLAAACKAYRVGNPEGAWPHPTGGAWVDAKRDVLKKLLGGDGADGLPALLDIPEERLEGSEGLYLDPWGNPYQIKTAADSTGEAGEIKIDEVVEVVVSFPGQFSRYYDAEDSGVTYTDL